MHWLWPRNRTSQSSFIPTNVQVGQMFKCSFLRLCYLFVVCVLACAELTVTFYHCTRTHARTQPYSHSQFAYIVDGECFSVRVWAAREYSINWSFLVIRSCEQCVCDRIEYYIMLFKFIKFSVHFGDEIVPLKTCCLLFCRIKN